MTIDKVKAISKKALISKRIFTGEKILFSHAILVNGNIIDDICPVDDIPCDYTIENLGKGILTAGFIDLQVNGGGGVLFNDEPTVYGIEKISKAHRKFGSTSILPTLISDDFKIMQQACNTVETAIANNIDGILGIHLEGPYINIARKGVHNGDIIRKFEDKIFSLMVIDKLGPSILTIAPEMLDAGILTKLAATGFKICAGHTAAGYDDIKTALSEGLSGFTHLFNAMTPMNSREPGVVGAALEDQDSYCGIIIDGHHIHKAVMKIAIAAKTTGRMILVSDAMPSIGAKDKAFKVNGENIIVENGRCITKDGVLAGSDLDMITAVKNTVMMVGLDMEEALRMASLYPATYMGVDDRLGSIAKGLQADIIHIRDDFTISTTWINGSIN